MSDQSASERAPTILLIDDSLSELRVLIDLLSARKWRVVVSFDGLDGFYKAQMKQPDLILLDVRMPGMDGFGTLRRLKADERTRTIPVIFLTAADDKADRLAGLSLGAVDGDQAFLSSPMSTTVSDRYMCGGTSRLSGAGLFLNTRPAKSKVEP